MKITDISIELTNVQMTKLSGQEASEIVGGSHLSNVAKKMSSFLKSQNINRYEAGVPTTGEMHDISCYLL